MLTVKNTYKLYGMNFFLADVRDGLGPFLAVYLISTQHWQSDDIGLIMTLSGLMTLIFQIPAGAITDKILAKRGVFSLACVLIAFAMLLIQFKPNFNNIVLSKIILGIMAAFFAPLIAAISLGLVGPKRYPNQVSMNEAFNHAGNIFAAFMVMLLANNLGLSSMFSFTAVMAAFALLFALSIKKQDIDHEVARGLEEKNHHKPSSLLTLLKNKQLLIFGVSIMLFHLANAAMLILIGEEVALKTSGENSVSFLALSIISAQAVMFLMALLAKRQVNHWGRKPLFLIAFIALPIRGLLFGFFDEPYYLLAIQLLDGVGAGLFGVLFPIVVADLTKGTGHYNLSLGTLAMLQGLGAAFSALLSGFIVTHYGFQSAFLSLTAIALLALGCFALGVKESGKF